MLQLKACAYYADLNSLERLLLKSQVDGVATPSKAKLGAFSMVLQAWRTAGTEERRQMQTSVN